MSGPEITPETEKKAETPAASHVSGQGTEETRDSQGAVSAEPAQDFPKQETDKFEPVGDPDSFIIPTDESPPIPEPVSSVASETEKKQASSLRLTQTHVSHLLSDVLQDQEESSVIKKLRFPMILDCLLGVGLLIAVGGFTIGLVQMYLIHSASQSISEQKYKTAIAILKGAPMPQVFGRPGSDTEELLSKARYLDAIETIETGADIPAALKELGEIRPGSRYFVLAQQAISENTEPAPLMLQGGAETVEKDPLPPQKESLVEKTLKEDESK